MFNEINYTLLSDGSSDQALMPIIDWTLRQIRPNLLIQGVRADLGRLKEPPKKLTDRIRKTLIMYPCELLFIHRDSEKEPFLSRKQEVVEAVSQTKNLNYYPINIITVRMMEAWLLINEQAIKIAAGNPNSRYKANLPIIENIENLPDPKLTLRNHLKEASGLKGRQLDKFNVGKAVHLVAENITDFSSLKRLSAYREFEKELSDTMAELEANR